MRKCSIVALAVMGLAGCASNSGTTAPIASDPSDISALAEFERLSIEMVHEMRLWAKAKEAASRDVLSDEQIRQRFFQSTHVPKGFDRPVTFNFYGPAIKAAEAVAISAGYEFAAQNVSGRRGDHIVDIKLNNERLVEALYEIGLATGSGVEVKVIEDDGSGKGKLLYRYVE